MLFRGGSRAADDGRRSTHSPLTNFHLGSSDGTVASVSSHAVDGVSGRAQVVAEGVFGRGHGGCSQEGVVGRRNGSITLDVLRVPAGVLLPARLAEELGSTATDLDLAMPFMVAAGDLSLAAVLVDRVTASRAVSLRTVGCSSLLASHLSCCKK